MRTTKANPPRTPPKNRKEAILEAASRVFSRNGYGSTRIEDVAREAKLSYGLAYYYFSSKDKLFHEVLKRAFDATLAVHTAALRAPGSSHEKLRSLIGTILATRFSDAGMPDTLVMSQSFINSGIPGATRALVDLRMRQIESALVKMIRGVQAEGHAAGKDPLILASMLNALLLGFSVKRISYPDTPMPDVDTFLFCLR